MQAGDQPGQGAGAGISPTDPGAPGEGDDDRDGTGPADRERPDGEDDLVSAVEDLVRDLVPDVDARG